MLHGRGGNEAECLARQCDLMIIIGGRHSLPIPKRWSQWQGTTQKRFSIETAAELQKVGLMAAESRCDRGAFTPSSIIEEVLSSMSEEIREEELSFEEMIDASLKPIYNGKVVKGMSPLWLPARSRLTSARSRLVSSSLRNSLMTLLPRRKIWSRKVTSSTSL